MRIMNVYAFNQEARNRFQSACDAWRPGQGGFPSVAMYMFFDENGNELQEGYVATEGSKHCWGRTEEEAKKAFQS